MCDCIDQINEQLAEQGAEITQRILLTLSNNDMRVSPPVVSTRWIDKKPRGKSLPVLLASHCPFCGKKYEDSSESKSPPEDSPFYTGLRRGKEICSNEEYP